MVSPRFVSRFCELLFRRLWLNILPVLIMLPATALFLSEPVYVSRASIYVQSNNLLETLTRVSFIDQSYLSVDVATPAQAVATELRELLQTDAFTYAVISESDWRDRLAGSPDDVREVLRDYREALTLAVEGDQLVRLELEAERPELAHQLAIATVNAYRSWKISRDVQDGQIAQSFFEEIIVSYREELERARDDLRFYLQQYPEPAVGARPVEETIQIETLRQNVALAEERMASLLDKAESARLALAQSERDVDQTYRVIDVPVVPPAPEPILERLLLALAFPAVGLALSIAIVLGRCAADRTVLSRFDVAEEFELPVLAAIAERGSPRSGAGRRQRPAASPSDDSVAGPAHA